MRICRRKKSSGRPFFRNIRATPQSGQCDARASCPWGLTPTAVVHEAYAKLAIAGSVPDVTERAFKRITAHVMREVLCDAARRRLAGKRGGKNAIRVPLDDQFKDPNMSIEQMLLVDDLLDRLHSVKVRAAAVFELA